MISQETVSSTYGVHSEVGRLRKVLVCSPGLAHRRLTPTNSDDLLFDDVMWVENAQRDHADFVNKLRTRDVDVVELHDLLAADDGDPRREVLAAGPQGRRQRGRGRPGRRHPGIPGDARAAAQLARVPHRRAGDLRPSRRVPLRVPRPGPRVDRRPRVPHAAAAQHPVHPRHDVLALRRRDPEPAVLAGPPRRDAADEGDLRVPPRLRRLHRVVGRPRAGLGPGHLRGRRHHAGRQRGGADGHERAHLAPGDHPGRGGPVRARRGRARGRRRHAQAARGDAPGHRLHLRRPRHRHAVPERSSTASTPSPCGPATRRPGVEVTDEGSTPFVDVVAQALGLPELRVVETGGDVYASERQQWDSGNNAVAARARAWSSPTTATP